MKITSINIVGKLPQGLVELYADISGHAKALDINYFVENNKTVRLCKFHRPYYGMTSLSTKLNIIRVSPRLWLLRSYSLGDAVQLGLEY